MSKPSKIFVSYQALAFVSTYVPLSLRYIHRRNENLVVTAVGKSFHTYRCSKLNLLSVKLLQENSKLSSEKYNVQISLSKEHQSFLDRWLEMALDNLNAEKDELLEKKCKEIRDLKAEMEAMEKQLQSNKKFIDVQVQEREQERENYLKELNKMQEIVREKEKIQSNEGQLMKEIESLEQVLRARIEDHQNAIQKKDMIENELRQSVNKIRDLRDVIEELEKQLNIKTKTEAELRQLHEKRGDCNALREEMEKKDYLIAMLQRSAPSTLKQKEELNTEESSECFKFLLLEKEEELNSKLQIIEHLQKQLVEFQKNVTDIPEMENELGKKRKIIDTLEKENILLKSEVEMWKNEITSLKELLESSKKQIDSKQAQVETLCEKLTNITQDNKRLEQDLDLVQNMMHQKERELETLHEETDAQIHGLYWLYRKSLSHNRSLIYQKKYLLMLLGGFQVTEKVILLYVNQIGRNIQCGPESRNSSFTADRPLRGAALFRSVAFVAVAVKRMKYCVRRWRRLARVPTPEILNAEVQSIFLNYSSASPTTTP